MTHPDDSTRHVPGPPARAEGVGSHEGTPPPEERQRLAEGFGAALRDMRKACGLTQAQLAAVAGCSREEVSNLECGRRRPEVETVRRFVRVLVVDVNGRSAVLKYLRRLAGDSWRRWDRRRPRRTRGRAAVERQVDAMIARGRRRILTSDK